MLFFTFLALLSLALLGPDAEAFQNFNDESWDCLECHDYYDDPYNCSSCHTIFSGGPSSNGHTAHLKIGLPQFCNTCHVDIGDDPPTSKCTICHFKLGLIKHHDYVAEQTFLSTRDTGICWMCHDEMITPDPEDTIPPGYEAICIPLDPCDGSEELLSNGSYTTSLDNDGDLLVDSADPDCTPCSPLAKTLADPHDYVTLQDAFDFAFDNDTIMSSKHTFVEDLSLNQSKAAYLESGFNCFFTTITGKTTVEGKVTMGPGALIIRRGTLVVRSPIEECTDGVDNDGDGLFDCNDPDCDSDIACVGLQPEVCTDCVDNDGDGLIDCADASCSSDIACSLALGSCTACHGDPPVDESTLVSIEPGTGSVTAGAHARHAITELFPCNYCHSGSVGGGPTHIDSFRITMGFSLFGGSYLGGTYDGQTTAIYDSSEVNTSVSNSGSMTCSNIYCHSNVQSVNGTAGPDTYASPMWNALSVACDSCHGQAAESDGQPDSGSHSKHAGSNVGEQNYDCSACHSNGGDVSENHADNILNLDLANTYGSSAVYSQDDHAPGTGGYGTCSNVDCHYGTVTPVWGSALPNAADCSDCHGSVKGTLTGHGEMTNGKHQQHIANVDTGLATFDCGRCHSETVTTGDNKTITGVRHANLSKDVYYDTLNPSASVNTCTTVYCHSDGKGGYNDQVLATAWESGEAIGCDGCHGDTSSHSGEPDYANTGPGTEYANDHDTHSETSICFYCHFMTTMDGVSIVAGSEKHINRAKEVEVHPIFNGQCSDTSFYNEFDCQANGGTWTPQVFSYDDQTKTCSNVICHPGSVQWGDDPANVTAVCGVCHETPPLNSVGQPHTIHFGIGNEGYIPDVYGEHNVGATETSYGFYCGFCHPWSTEEHQNDPSAGTPGAPKHMEIWLGTFFSYGVPVPGGGPLARGGTPIYDTTLATENVDPGIAKDNAGTPVFYYGYHDGTCKNIYCHSDGRGEDPLHTPTWKLGDRPGDCTYCHGNDASSASIIDTGSHEAHIVNGGYGCSECHYDTVTDNRTIKDKRKHVSNGFNALTGEPVAAGEAYDLQPDPQESFVYSYSANGSQCATISCHGDTDATWGDPDSVNCQTCHGLGTGDVDDFIYGNNTRAQIDKTEWDSVGHGRGTTYIGSGNPGADITSCYYCHDSTVTHGDAGNPFRLLNNSGPEGQNGVCLTCHKTGATGYDPDGGGPLPLKVGGLNVDSHHYGPLHDSGNNGGKFCWDCHEPHGDSNIFMVHNDVTKQSDGTYGVPLTTSTVTFMANNTGTDYAKSSSPYDGICNACHTSTDHYTSDSGDGHIASVACIYCHEHTGDDVFLAFEPSYECSVCHGDPPVTSEIGGPNGILEIPGTTGATSPGVHALHATAQEWTVNRTYIRYLQTFPYYEIVTEPTLKKGYNFPCETCHEGGMSFLDLNLDSAIQIGGSVITYGGNRILNPPYSFAGTQYSYKGASPVDQNDPARPVVTGDVILSGSDMKCSTYCHSDGDAIYNGLVDTDFKSPAWVSVDSATSSLPCDACHGYPPENGSTQFSSHGKHVESWRYTCDKCHYETTEDGITITNPAKHGDGNINVTPKPGSSEFRYSFTPGGGGSCFAQPGGTQAPYVGCHLIDDPDSGLYGIHGPQTWQRFD